MPTITRSRAFLLAVASLSLLLGVEIHHSDRLRPAAPPIDPARPGSVAQRDSLTPQNPARCPDGAVRIPGVPKKIADAAPVYPESARDMGLSGVVIVQVLIGKDGEIAAAKVVRGVPPLDQAAIDAVRKWKYTPSTLNGAAVCVGMTVTLDVRP